MINNVRKLLSGSSLYKPCAKLYHSLLDFYSRAGLFFSETKYLTPLSIRGGYRSQYGQDYYLEKLGLVERDGFFVEIGANHPTNLSNSYYFEKYLGWEGLCIDGIDFSQQYKEERPKSKFIHCLVDEFDGYADFYQVENEEGWEDMVSSMHKRCIEHGRGFKASVKKVRTLPLSKILNTDREVDLCLIDVEGHEFAVLNSINWNSSKPKVFVIENSGQYYSKSKLVKYMRTKGYKHFARIGSSDDIFVNNI